MTWELSDAEISLLISISEANQSCVYAMTILPTLLKDEIRRLKPEEMTPMQALQRLMDLKENYGK